MSDFFDARSRRPPGNPVNAMLSTVGHTESVETFRRNVSTKALGNPPKEPRTRLAAGGCQGRRVQYSVFECVLSQLKYDELRQRLKKQVKAEEDSVRFYPLSQHTLSQVETWGDPPVTEPPSSIII